MTFLLHIGLFSVIESNFLLVKFYIYILLLITIMFELKIIEVS